MASYSSDVPQMGLLTSMASGVREGLIGYQTIQNQRHAQQMQELAAGVTKDEDGNLTLTPQAQAKRDFEAQKQQDDMATYQKMGSHEGDFRDQFAKTHGLLAKQVGLYGEDVTPESVYPGMSPREIEEMEGKNITPLATIAAAKTKADASMYGADSRADAASDRAARAQGIIGEKQDKAYTELRKSLETFRGNQSVQQAAAKVQNADSALAIVKNKDPNTLTRQDLQLLNDELAKVAMGGVPGEHGVQMLMPNNLQTKLAEMQNFLSSKPTDAQAGEYVKHNMKYLEDMKDVAKETLSNYRRNILKGYRNRVSKDNYNEAIADYELAPRAAAQTAFAQQPQTYGGILAAQQGAAPPQVTVNLAQPGAQASEDDAAMDWAMKNPSDPMAAQIMKLHGGRNAGR